MPVRPGRGSTVGAGPPDRTPDAQEPERRRSGPPARSAPRAGTPAREQRRAIEAELIGLSGGVDPDWWGPSWEQGLRPDLPAGELFDELAGFHGDLRVLHGLGVGGTGSTIDHVVIGAGGVVVVATDRSIGRVRTDGVHLRVRGKDRSPAVDVALWQAEVVRTTLEQRGISGVVVRGVLHWEHLDGLGDKAICLRGVPLLSAGATVGLAAAGTTVSPHMVERIATALGPCPRLQ